jgi:hypothetical protein
MQMDLCLKRRTAGNAVIWALNAMGAVLLLWTCSVSGDTASKSRDYLFPAESLGGNLHASSHIESSGSVSKLSALVQYEAFDGQFYDLVQNRGRHVNVLVPQSAVDGPNFTADHLEELVDRLDMLYTLYVELLQGEPGGSGLLNIAFIPQTCGSGCGLVGGRGIEVQSSSHVMEDIIRELDAGRLDSILLHEMAHNFDTFSAYLHYLPDHAHAWTDMFEFFAPYRYSRDSTKGRSPDDLYNSPVRAVWKDYVTDESARWDNCVRDQACGDLGLHANGLWAMVYYRIESLYGIEALLDSFRFIRDYARTHAPPVTDEDKEGLRILSLAVGVKANISCYLDSLKWPVPDATRQELQKRFGSGGSLCGDQDNDGFIAINGDCDDNDPSRNILSDEIAFNGKDDDCDELVDEKSLVEAEFGSDLDNFTGKVSTTLPTEISGTSFDPDDRDTFSFSLAASRLARVTLCAQSDFRGWAAGLKPDGNGLDSPNWYVYRPAPGCSSNTFDFSAFQQGTVSVIPDGYEGPWSLTISEGSDLLPDHSASLQVEANPAGGMTLRIDDREELFSGLGADEMEIWISGAGVQIFEPWTENMAVTLNRQDSVQLSDGALYQARIRPRAGGLPLKGFAAGQLFRYDATAKSLPVIDHSFSGAWFDPDHEGEGFIVEVLGGDRALVYWFTYQADGSQRWMLGVGDIEANKVVIDEMLDSHGARFGDHFDPDDVVLQQAGSFSITFLDCASALVNYSIDGRGDHQKTTRLTSVLGHGCGRNEQPPARDLSGSWYDPSHDGEGFVVEQLSATEALVFWFTYDGSGQQSWLFSSGSIKDGQIEFPQMLQPRGAQFGRSYDPAQVSHHEWGSLTLELDCEGGKASYSSAVSGYSNGSQNLVPLTRLQNSGCLD